MVSGVPIRALRAHELVPLRAGQGAVRTKVVARFVQRTGTWFARTLGLYMYLVTEHWKT